MSLILSLTSTRWLNEIKFYPPLRVNMVSSYEPFFQVYTILDEFILSGEVEENAKTEILERVHEVEKLE